jgi:hypothetical protein
MSRVYSTRFIAGTSFDYEEVSYTVPAGYVAVVRCLTALSNDEGVGQTAQWCFDLGSGTLVYFAYQILTGANASEVLDLRLVLHAGETLIGQAQLTPVTVLTASGYLLGLP